VKGTTPLEDLLQALIADSVSLRHLHDRGLLVHDRGVAGSVQGLVRSVRHGHVRKHARPRRDHLRGAAMEKLLIATVRNRTPELTHHRTDIRSVKYPKASRDVPPDKCWALPRSPAEKLVSARSVTGGSTTTPRGQLMLTVLGGLVSNRKRVE
jgi:hypothetical protein